LKSELGEEGNQRTLSLVGGGTITEKLEKRSDDEMLNSYSIIDSPLPLADYQATLSVKDDGSGKSHIEWTGEFSSANTSEDEAIRVIEGNLSGRTG